MSARYKMGSKMAEVCQNLGFSLSGGDLGYQTFLYNNENDLRSVLMFLIDKLPKEQNMDIGEEQELGKIIYIFFIICQQPILNLPLFLSYIFRKAAFFCKIHSYVTIIFVNFDVNKPEQHLKVFVISYLLL